MVVVVAHCSMSDCGLLYHVEQWSPTTGPRTEQVRVSFGTGPHRKINRLTATPNNSIIQRISLGVAFTGIACLYL